jgi:hypothetical protein
VSERKGKKMNDYWVRVGVELPVAPGETHEFLTGVEATDLNEAWAIASTKYTGAGSDWYPQGRLVSLSITPQDPFERVPVPEPFNHETQKVSA